jgi:hypothetical protein
MTELEDAVRSALRSLPEPEMRIPAGFSDEMRHRYQRRRWYAPVVVAGLVAAVAFTAVLWQAQTDMSSPIPPAVTPTPATATPVPATSSPPPAVIANQHLSEAAQPSWTERSDADLLAWSGSPHAFTVTGSPIFVVGDTVPGPLLAKDPSNSKKPQVTVEFQRTDAQVDMSREKGVPAPTLTRPSGIKIRQSPQRNPLYGCATGSVGIEDTFVLTSPPIIQLRCWPTLQENIWVWPQLPSNATTLAYVLEGHIVARSTTLDGTGAIRIPRPASAAADQGQLEALTAAGDVIGRAKLPWIA